MYNQIEMGILYSFNDLPKKELDLFFRQVVLVDILIKFAPLSHLHNDEDIRGGIEHFIKFNYIKMTDEFKDFEFPRDLYTD
jgi:hypothetical protein